MPEFCVSKNCPTLPAEKQLKHLPVMAKEKTLTQTSEVSKTSEVSHRSFRQIL